MSQDAHRISDPGGLRARYRDPVPSALAKQLDHLDAHCRDFIAHSPFLALGTSDETGRCDVSPRGGPPGFVAVLDERRLAIPDLAGNNRLDSYGNVVANPGVGLLFFVPGVEESLRVNGRGAVTTEPPVLDACALRDVRPNVALLVQVEEAYIHCAKAFRRGGLWRPETWPDLNDMAKPARMVRDQVARDLSEQQVHEALERDYRGTLWQAGGQPDAEPG